MLRRLFSEPTSITPPQYANWPGKRVYSNEDLGARLKNRNISRKRSRAGYMVRMQLCALGALAAVYGVFQLDLSERAVSDYDPVGQEIVVLEDIQQTRQLVKPPPPPRPPIPIEVPNDAVLEQVDLAYDAEISFDEPVDLPPPPVAPPPPPVEEVVEEEPDIFIIVEEMPTIVGGLAALVDLIEYPEIAMQAGIQGTVVVQIVISEDGSPTTPIVVKGVHNLLDEAAIEAVMKLQFTPGKQRGKAVPVQLGVPVRFVLQT